MATSELGPLQLPPALKRHSYPFGLQAFVAVIAVVFFFSLRMLPPYLACGRLLTQATIAEENHNYSQAGDLLLAALKKVPSSKRVRIELALLWFEHGSQDDKEAALGVLEGVLIDEDDWNRIRPVLPREYLRYFSKSTSE
jgi:hypothetical protein